MKKIYTYLFFSASVICIGLFLLVHMPPGFINRFLTEPEKAGYDDFRSKGDLYYMCQVDHFNDHLPPATYKFRESIKQSPVDSADVIIFGDSFFDHSRFPSIADRLHDSLGLKVCLIRRYDIEDSILSKARPNTIIITGIVERNIYETYNGSDAHESAGERFHKTKLMTRLFPFDLEKRYQLLSRRSVLTEGIERKLNTTEFDLFDLYNPGVKFDPLSGKLFLNSVLKEETKDPFVPVPAGRIDSIAYAINKTAERVKQKGCRFIFFPVPNKETIYFSSSTPYNRFLPLLAKQLKEKKIETVRLYDLFRENAGRQLYFRTDTHWNNEGISLAFNELRKILIHP